MKTPSTGLAIIAFLVVVVFTTAWGSVVQTQYNLGALASLGVEVNSVRMETTARDLFSGFFPTYGGYIVLPALLVAFLVAGLIVSKWHAARGLPMRMALFGLGGGVAIFVGIPLVNELSPVALLVGASRDWTCTFWMAVGGALAGVLFAALTHVRPPRQVTPAGHRSVPH